MITTSEGLQLALEQWGRVYKAIAALRAEYAGAREGWIAVMAEGWIDQACQLQREIEEYTGSIMCMVWGLCVGGVSPGARTQMALDLARPSSAG